ncbi:hypothetical protein ACWNT8_04385 [Pigmentibacter ruber]
MSNFNKKVLFLISTLVIHSNAFADGSYLFCSNGNSKWHWAPYHNKNEPNPNTQYFWLEGNLKIVNAPIALHSALNLDLNNLFSRTISAYSTEEKMTIRQQNTEPTSQLEAQLHTDSSNQKFSDSNEWEKLENWNAWEEFSNENLKRNKRASISGFNNQVAIAKNQIATNNGLQACRLLVNFCTSTFGNEFRFVGAAGNALAESDWGYIVADNLICPNWDYPLGLVTTSHTTVGSLIAEISADIITSGPIKGALKGGKVPSGLTRPNSLATSNNGGANRRVVPIEKTISNVNSPSTDGAISPMDPFGTRINEITHSVSAVDINSRNGHLGAERRPSQIAEQLVSSSSQNPNTMGQRKLSYSDMLKTHSSEEINTAANPFQRTGSLRIEMYKLGGNARHKVPSRAYSISDLIDFNTAKKFWNNEGRIKGLTENFDLYEIDIPIVEEHVRVRDAKRVIVDRISGKRWYSPDHYESFVDMESPIDPVKLAEKNKNFLQSKL